MYYNEIMQPLTVDIISDLLRESGLKKKFISELKFQPDTIADWDCREFIVITDRHYSKGVLITDVAPRFVVPFRLQPRKASSVTGRIEAIICDFCSTWQRGSNSAVITFDRTDKSSRSYLCCADLLCSLHVRDLTTQAVLSRTQLREQVPPGRRVERLRESLYGILIALS